MAGIVTGEVVSCILAGMLTFSFVFCLVAHVSGARRDEAVVREWIVTIFL